MIIIYHSRDLDGYCSGAICKKKYPDAELIGYDYGQPFPYDEIPAGQPIIIVDVSLPMPDMFELHKYSNYQLTWIDHHISAIKDYKDWCEHSVEYTDGFLTAILENGIVACEGAWKYLFPDKSMPETVELLGKYDTWRNDDIEDWNSYILPFQYGMRMNVKSADDFPQWLLETDTDGAVQKIKDLGLVILEYQREQNAMSMKKAFPIQFEKLCIIACNSGGGSTAFDSVWDEEKYDAMMSFKFDGNKWIFSLYTTKDINLSVIAKKYGGGGHAKACGFSLTTEQLINNIPHLLGFGNAF